MEARSTRRLAVCSGAVVATIGAGLLIVPMANAEGAPTVGVGALPSSAASTVGGLLGGGSSSTPSSSASSSASSTASDPAAGATATPSTPAPTDAASGAAPATSGAAPDPVASAVGGLAALPTASAGATTPVTVLPGPAATATAPSGVASIGTSGSGDLTVVVGQQPDGGSLATVHLGASSGLSTSDSGVLPVAVDRVADPAGGAVQQATGGGSAAGAAPGAVGAAAGLLSLDVTPSLGTVYPVRDGYRDSVLFRLGAVTQDGAVTALTGTAVLRRAGREVARWRFTRSDQALRWDGRDRGRVRAGAYTLTVSAKDALGAVFQDKTRVSVSRKRLVAQTRTVSNGAVSGARRMFAPARAALARGAVTVVIRTVASRVKGKQYLVFTKDGRRLAIRVRNGAHSSREITVPSTFAAYTVSHTWKAGTVRLKKVRYTYTYQSLQ